MGILSNFIPRRKPAAEPSAPEASRFEALRAIAAESYARSVHERQAQASRRYPILITELIDLTERYGYDEVQRAIRHVGASMGPVVNSSVDPRR